MLAEWLFGCKFGKFLGIGLTTFRFGGMIAWVITDLDSSERGPAGLVDSSWFNVGDEAEMPTPVVEIVAEPILGGCLAEQRLRCDSRVARCWNGT